MARAAAAKAREPARLRTYRAKRNFQKTPEPSGAAAKRKRTGHGFVVQKHAARRLHYDFRLEQDGVLLSWAVPKGPSLVPGDRRLAVRVEDHPIEYADFEGLIPADEYGGGTVVVWDRGTWEPEPGKDPHEGLEKGRLTFELHGEKLRGRWHLVRTGGAYGSRASGKENWLLFKGRDEAASEKGEDVLEARPESVLSGRTIEEVRESADRVWHSNRSEKTSGRGTAKGAATKAKVGAKGSAKRASKRSARAAETDDDLADLVRSLPVDVPLTNLDKILYPEIELTKAGLLAYLAVVADRLLAQVAHRPLTLVRCPDGRRKSCFFQKHVTETTPEAIGSIEIREKKGLARYMVVSDLAGLIALGQLGTLEIHTWGCRDDDVERPDQLVLDLDPDPALPWEQVVDAALDLRARLDDLGLVSFVKTTGGKGLHVVAPVQRRIGWDDFLSFARGVAEQMAADQPERYTANQSKARRKKKIYVDALRNGRGATAVAAYSPRARENATVATPLTWSELEGKARPGEFTVLTLPKRLESLRKDPWAGYDDVRQSITAAARRRVRAD